MKILFLDIDGVLNNEQQDWSIEKFKTISNENVAELNWLMLTIPNLKIVISSSWRDVLTIQEISDHLVLHGFNHPDRIIDKTKDLGWLSKRGRECMEWILDRIEGFEEVTHFAMVDDHLDFFGALNKAQLRHLVITNPQVGLTSKDVTKLKEILSV